MKRHNVRHVSEHLSVNLIVVWYVAIALQCCLWRYSWYHDVCTMLVDSGKLRQTKWQQNTMEFNKIFHRNSIERCRKCQTVWKSWKSAIFEVFLATQPTSGYWKWPSKNFGGLAGEWDLLGIWSSSKYMRMKRFARHPQSTHKKVRISLKYPFNWWT